MLADIKKRAADWALKQLTEHRGLVLAGVGLPVGMAFDTAVRVRNGVLQRLGSAPKDHDKRVAKVQEQVKRWASQPAATRRPMCTDRKTWMNLSTRFTPKDQWHRIQMSGLRDILSIDTARRTVHVEPFVTVGQATRYLVPKGWMLAVNLEIEDATLGGLSMAVGMTTHSHKVGLLQETVAAYEVVLADGRLLRVTREEHPELFLTLPWSHGTLGLLVGLELAIIPVKPYVHLTYTPAHSQEETCEAMRAISTAPDAPTFVEATVFSKHRAVIMTGEFADAPADRSKINRLGLWYKPWFYTHVERFQEQGGDEYVPLRHYLLRHNRSIFWVVADMIPFGNQPAFRFLFGWLMPPKIAFLKFSTTPAVRKMTYTMQVFQDIVLPMSAMKRALDLTDELFQLYPILLYPSRVYDHGPTGGQLRQPRESDLVPGTDHAMYFDLGVYGVPLPVKQKRQFKTVHAMRKMEEFTREVNGFPFLYADTFMTREEFAEMFDLRLYEQVRRATGADAAFPHLYDKIRPEVDVFAVLEEEAAWGG